MAMRTYAAYLLVVLAFASISTNEALIWRHLFAWQVRNPANISYVLGRVQTWPNLAPDSCGILTYYSSTTDASGGILSSNTSVAFVKPDIAGFIEFETLDGIACYFAWLRTRADYNVSVPLLGTTARMQQVDDSTTDDKSLIWLSISRFPTLACGTANYTAPSSVVGLAVANMFNLTQFAPTGPDSGEISADLGLNPILYPDLPPNWNWGTFLDFNSSRNLTGYLNYLRTQPAYLTVLNATQSVMNFGLQVSYNITSK